MATYEKLREKVIYGDDYDVFVAREVAYQWHGGQDTALYSFASTDATVWSEQHRRDLVADIKQMIAAVKKDPEKYYATWEDVDQYTREKFQSGMPKEDWGDPADAGLESLEMLLKVVKALPAKNNFESED